MSDTMCCLTCEGEGTVTRTRAGDTTCPSCSGKGTTPRPRDWEHIARLEGYR